ncbi:MAG: C4-type zinc ribbon domain-containing protein [Hydrogenobacter sp.]|uniref:zinc ribbon domain-containing protein n=1 Tax=Hydrogenobacter thermophilus TaxID=940 RepID=UPI0030FA86CF
MKREDLKLLLKLQDIEMGIKRLERTALKLKDEEEKFRKEISKLEEEEASILLDLKRLNEEAKKINDEILICREGIKRAESRLNMVRKAQEYKALLREKAKCEDRIIKLNERLKKLEMDRKEKESTYASQKKTFERKYRELKEEIEHIVFEKESISRKLENLKREEAKIREEISTQALREYDFLKREVEHPVIVPIISFGACGGCGMRLPATLYSKAVSGQIVKCPNCARILYYEA